MKKISLADKNKIGGFLRVQTFKNGKLIRETDWMPNKVVSGSGGYGRNLIMRALANDTTYGIALTTASVGTGTSTPADSDTDLQTPVITGIPVTQTIVSNDSLQVNVFASDATLTNGTYKEFGLKIGTQLFCRILISPNYTKGTGEDTLFTYTTQLT